jgi:type IX secretion system PorP/SprF family membrane protein
MKTKLIIGFAAIMVFRSAESFGQQDPHFTQYFDNTLFVNPAYAGSNDMLNLTAIHREQWVGFAGRPSSSTFSIHSPLSYRAIGLGLTLVNDKLGPVQQTMVYGDFSYSIRFRNEKSKLSFGLSGGVEIININTSKLATTDAADPNLAQNTRNRTVSNFGGGIYYHNPVFFLGVSSPKLLENTYDGAKTDIEQRHYFGIIGGVITMSEKWKLRPTAQVKATNNAPLSADMSLAGIYNDKFWIGGMYRLNAAFGAFVQFQFSPQFKAGLASEFGTQKLSTYNQGTFEILLSYDFVFKKQGIRSPRYF